jgi:hypothetical protein
MRKARERRLREEKSHRTKQEMATVAYARTATTQGVRKSVDCVIRKSFPDKPARLE